MQMSSPLRPSPVPLLAPPRFGRKQQQDVPPGRPVTPVQRDPKPSYFSAWRNLRNSVLLLTGLGGAWGIPNAVDKANQTLAEHAQNVKNKPTPQPDDLSSALVDGFSVTYAKAREIAPLRATQDLYIQYILRFQLLYLAMLALNNSRKRTLSPSKIYAPLHAQGFTGQGLKVGVLDAGFYPTRLPNGKKIQGTLRNAAQHNAPIKPQDSDYHGTMVTNLIAQALPDAEFSIMTRAANDSALHPASPNIRQFSMEIHEALLNKDLERITMDTFRLLFQDLVTQYAKAITTLVDEGNHVINVSLNPEQAVRISLLQNVRRLKSQSQIAGFFNKLFRRKPDQSANPGVDQLAERLEYLYRTRHQEIPSKQLEQMYQPWFKALDYAHSQGVMVVVGAGNDGLHHQSAPDVIGNINPFGLRKHPALLVVGSTNEQRQVSHFSSEYTQRTQPDLAGNGDGELSSNVPFQWRRPFHSLHKQMESDQAIGTSFAAPDVTGLYGMMRQVAPDLNDQEIKAILLGALGQSTLSDKETDQLLIPLIQRMLNDHPDLRGRGKIDMEHLQTLRHYIHDLITRRVGQGSIAGQRRHIVEQARLHNDQKASTRIQKADD